MSEVRVNNLSNENNTGGPTISGITTYSGRHFFVPPQGDTASRPSDCEPGSFRFNTDSAHLEYFRGNTIGWVQIDAEPSSDVLGGGTGSNTGLGHRAVISPGQVNPSGYVTNIDFMTISTLGNAQDFGNAGVSRDKLGSGGDRSRGLFIGGEGVTDTIEFITFASTGYVADFGNIGHGNQMRFVAGCSDSTRTIFGGGYTGPATYNIIEYVTTQSTGNGVDFGDLISGDNDNNAKGACSSSTRGIFAGGDTHNYGNRTDRIEFVTISTTGNSTDFGNLTGSRAMISGCSNSTRGLIFGGFTPSVVNNIDFITIATAGNATDFGDATVARSRNFAASSPTRAISGGGSTPSGSIDTVDFVEIATTGNALDFGDLIGASTGAAACSSGHGGL